MKPGVLLTISVVANVALVACILVLLQRRPVVAPPRPVVAETVTNIIVRGQARRLETTNLASLITNVWRTIESSDYRRYIAGLRTIGCPEETIRDIIIADLNKLYAQKARALNPALKDYRFWQPDPSFDDPRAREYQRQLNQLEQEKREMVRALLGVDYVVEMAKQSTIPNYADRQLNFLSEGKRNQLQALAAKYAELEQAIYDQASGGELTPEQKQALAELREKQRAEMGTFLTAAEIAEYDMRTSPTAQDLRYRMGAFEGSEADFRNLYRIQKNYEDQLRSYQAAGTLTPEVQAALQKAKEQEMKTLLGDRYEEYQRTQDASYRELYQTAQRNNLSKEAVQMVYEMKRLAEEQRRQLLANEELTDEQKAAGMAALRAETERAVKEALGEKAFSDYQRRGGNWLLNLGEVEKKPAP